MLAMTMPSGFEKSFERCAEEFAKGDGPDMSRIVQIAADTGSRNAENRPQAGGYNTRNRG